MSVTKMQLKFNNISKSSDVPLECPYCGKVIEFTQRGYSSLDINIYNTYYIFLLYSKCCDKNSVASYRHDKKNKIIEFLSMYPNPKPSVLPDSIHVLSPRFITLYADSEYTYSKNMFELAGSGFRNALEILIKDFAINELNEDSKEVSKKSLFDAIESYLPDPKLKKAADVVRILGNDYTHYDRKYNQYDIDLLKVYLDIFIKRIDAEYLMSHPPVARQKN